MTSRECSRRTASGSTGRGGEPCASDRVVCCRSQASMASGSRTRFPSWKWRASSCLAPFVSKSIAPEAENTTHTKVRRGRLLRMGAAGTAVGAATLALPRLALAAGPESVQVAEIYQLQAAFHRAKTTQDLDLMMSLWADEATFTNNSTNSKYMGSAQIRSFWLGS